MLTIIEKINIEIKKLEGPIIIFGAGGFIGSNLFRYILTLRNDVYAVTSKPFIPWRIEDLNEGNILHCDITKKHLLITIFEKFNFKVVFNFAAFGAYSNQIEVNKIYDTNFGGLLNILEITQKYKLKAFIHAGSSSEYGLNCAAPNEDDKELPNSHYAVSKVACANLIKYYGIIREVPVLNLRFYSIYGAYEDPDRLVPKLINCGMNGNYPPLVNPEISRDFVYIDDAIYACLLAANSDFSKNRGQSINIASGEKTTILQIVNVIQNIFNIQTEAEWNKMPNRKWDLINWYGNPDKAKAMLNWQNETKLEDGLRETYLWQKKYSYPLYEKKMAQDKIRFKLSAVIACYKDAQAVPFMYERLSKVFKKINVDYEIIFVNDASPDNAQEVLEKLANEDNKVIVIEHSRNFGSQSAFSSGMEIADGDGIILLDGDLQDPPELIESFFYKWQEGYDVVYGKRVAREGSQWLAKFYKLFYRLFRQVSYVPMPLDAGDFSLMDKKVVKELIKLPETDQFLRGLRAWVGFKQIGIDYVRPERMFGVTTNNWRKNIGWARKAIFSFSYVPLEFLTYLGISLTLLSIIALITQIILYFTSHNIPHGITTIICLILFFGGLNMFAISIIGEYQAKIIEETKKRPKFIRKNIIKK